MSKRILLHRLIGPVVMVILIVSMCGDAFASARRPTQQGQTIVASAIPKDKRSWAGFPWIIGVALTAGAVGIGLKNSKRTHLD